MEQRYLVYVLSCADGSLYTGYTANLRRRLAQHAAGRAARYTRSRLPVTLLAYWTELDRSTAMRVEASIKRLDRSAKLALLSCTEEQLVGSVVLAPPHRTLEAL
jgi:predicted GIY-YIG superfamily endonuclease